MSGLSLSPAGQTRAQPVSGVRAWARDWGWAAVLALGVAILAAVFRREADAAFRVWMDSTAYNHCFLVLPVALYLAWERRGRLAGTAIRPAPAAILLGILPALAWFVADRMGIMEGRQLAAMAGLIVFVVAVVGWQVARAMAAPLAYLFFLVPVGGFLVPAMQRFTAHFITGGLSLFGIRNFSDGLIIQIPEGTFEVAEACAGLRFLVASIAFGTLYALTLYRSPGRRIAFIGASLVVPIIANGIRALGIVVLGHVLGSAEAATADHIIYGWGFFSVIIIALALAGAPFRQDVQAAPLPRGGLAGAGLLRPGTVALGVLALVLAGPAVAATIGLGSGEAVPTMAVRAPAGCAPASSGTEGAEVRVLACGEVRLTVRSHAFPRATTPDILLAARGEAAQQGAAVLWIDGRPAGGSIGDRLRQARVSVTGEGAPPVLVSVAAEGGTPAERRAAAERVLQQPPGG